MQTIDKTIGNLKKNNYLVHFAEDKKECLSLIKTFLKKGDTVGVGGSMTLFETKIIDLLRNGDYNFLDRYKEGLNADEIEQIFHDSFSADFFISSTNAITENGELYNVDGKSNRVAPILYGPKNVIIVAGKNKIVKNIDEAIKRVKTIAAPLNCKRLDKHTYCFNTGKCVKENSNDFSGCESSDRICCSYVVSSYQRDPGRIKIIIVNEDLGY